MFSKLVIENKKPSKKDIIDAIEHASEIFDIKKEKFQNAKIKFIGNLSVKEIGQYDDLSSWLELSPDDYDDYESYRGKDWEQKSKQWNTEGIPPVVVVTTPQGSIVGDGRGRINFANMRNFKIPTWELIVENNSSINEKTIISRFNELFDYYKSLNVYAKDQILGIVVDDLRQEFENFLVKGKTSGSTRKVFIFNDVVVKFAPSIYGTTNNKKEINNAICLDELAPKIIDYDKENYYWLIMEKVENNLDKVKILVMNLFPNLIKFDFFGEPFDIENAHQNAYDEDLGIQKIAHEFFKDSAYHRLAKGASEEGKEWLDSFVNGVEKCKFDTYDLSDFNWGIGLKTGRLIPLDLG